MTSWIEFEMEKNFIFHYNLNILFPISTTLEKDFEKGF